MTTIASLTIDFSEWWKTWRYWLLAGIVPLIAFSYYFHHYLPGDTFFWLSLSTLPLTMIWGQGGQRINLFAWACAVFTLFFFLPSTIGVFTLLCLMLLFLTQSAIGKGFSLLSVAHLLLLSPLTTYISTLISFPIRLKLSAIVGSVLTLIDHAGRAEGNMIHMPDYSFLIDEACSGLYLFRYSLLFGTLIIAYSCQSRRMTSPKLVFAYLCLFGLILLGNVIRITLLVLFAIKPEHWFHEGLGMLIFISQILFPFYLLIKWLSSDLNNDNEGSTDRHSKIKFPLIRYTCLICAFTLLIYKHRHNSFDSHLNRTIRSAGFTTAEVSPTVTSLRNDSSLIYVKSPVPPYRGDHNPLVCWKGSGYVFKKVEQITVGDKQINLAELIKNNERLFTAWWFESADHQTGSQWEWRKSALINDQQYYLINLTCASRNMVLEELALLLERKLIQNSLAMDDT